MVNTVKFLFRGHQMNTLWIKIVISGSKEWDNTDHFYKWDDRMNGSMYDSRFFKKHNCLTFITYTKLHINTNVFQICVLIFSVTFQSVVRLFNFGKLYAFWKKLMYCWTYVWSLMICGDIRFLSTGCVFSIPKPWREDRKHTASWIKIIDHRKS